MVQILKTSFTTETLSIKNNHLKGRNFKLQPKISRKTGKIKDNIFFTALILEVTSTSNQPFPIDVTIDFRGIFQFNPGENQEAILEYLKKGAVEMMFPYLRSILTNLTTTAMLPPIILPVMDISKLFPDDRETTYVN